MSKSYTIVEKTQKTALGMGGGMGGGWWFVLQGKFGDMAPLSFVGQAGTVETTQGAQPVEVADAQLRHGVLSVRLDGVDGHQVKRQAQLVLGEA